MVSLKISPLPFLHGFGPTGILIDWLGCKSNNEMGCSFSPGDHLNITCGSPIN